MALSRTGFPAPWPMQLATLKFGAEAFYRLLDAQLSEGIVASGDLAVSQKAGGANLSVDVAAGLAVVAFDSPYGGKRIVYNDAASNSGTPGSPGADWVRTFASPDATLPRVDRVVLLVRDGTIDGGGSYDAKLDVVPGTPTTGATLANLSGAAAVPANALHLANVLVPAGATAITDAEIDTGTDFPPVAGEALRPRAVPLRSAAPIPACRLTHSVAQSIANATDTAVALDGEDYDTDRMHDTATSNTRIYARTAGRYRITATVEWAGNGTGVRLLKVKKNGSVVAQSAEGAADFGTTAIQQQVVTEVELAAGDYVELIAHQTSGGALNVNATAGVSPVVCVSLVA